MCVSESRAMRAAELSARPSARLETPAAYFRKERRSKRIGIGSAHPVGEQVLVLGPFAPDELLYILEFFFQACTTSSQADYVQHDDQPGGREAVKHVGEVSSVHSIYL